MTKKLLLMIMVAAVGAVVAKKLRAQPDARLDVPARIPAETLEVRAEQPPAPEPETQPESEPTEERHALRPSPVPRERPVWSPPVAGGSTGKHAAHGQDDTGSDG
jgi:hypothetical protein